MSDPSGNKFKMNQTLSNHTQSNFPEINISGVISVKSE